jgi:AsmA protein
MTRVITWAGVALAGAAAVAIGALLLIPLAVDLDPYRAALEKALTQASGRPVRVSGDLRLSLFPWVGVSIRGLALANPVGFSEPDMVTVPSAELRMRFLPLLAREVQVERVELHDPRLVLETRADGRANWDADPAGRDERSARASGLPAAAAAPPAAAIFVSDLKVANGRVTVIDHRTGLRQDLTDIRIAVQHISLDRPVRVEITAVVNGRPVSGLGSVGPIGPNLGHGTVPVEFSVAALGELKLRAAGTLENLLVGPVARVSLRVDEFSPRRLMAALGLPIPSTSDPGVWQRASLQASVQAEADGLSVYDGVLHLDDSQVDVSLNAVRWGRRGLSLDLHADRLDLDRYLHASGERQSAGDPASGPDVGRDARPERPGRRLPPIPNLNGTVAVDRLTIVGARLERVTFRLTGNEGVLTIDPFAAALYDGMVSGRAAVDLRADTPRTTIDATLDRVQVSPLLRDLGGNDLLEGRGRAEFALSMTGDRPVDLRQTLTGRGRLDMAAGAVTGFNLLAGARGAKAGGEGGRPHTDFSELSVPFTVENGRVHITEATADSGLIRFKAAGQVDLVQEKLNLRVEPRMAGEGGVGIVITGPLSNPEVRPDLEGVTRKALKKAFGAEGDEPSRKTADLLKGLLQKKTP